METTRNKKTWRKKAARMLLLLLSIPRPGKRSNKHSKSPAKTNLLGGEKIFIKL
jgi:hypothetical protein